MVTKRSHFHSAVVSSFSPLTIPSRGILHPPPTEIAAPTNQQSPVPQNVAPQPRYLPPAVADDCSSESIETVSDDGAFIAILGGGHYIVDEVDRVDTAIWLATDDVVVCYEGGGEVKLIHDSDIAHAHQIH
jgi:hypothetical protein